MCQPKACFRPPLDNAAVAQLRTQAHVCPSPSGRTKLLNKGSHPFDREIIEWFVTLLNVHVDYRD